MEEIQKVIDMKELGRRFKLIRQRLGMTQTEVGKQLNTTQLMICRVEKGENVLSPLLLSLLAFYSQSVSMDYLFPGILTSMMRMCLIRISHSIVL